MTIYKTFFTGGNYNIKGGGCFDDHKYHYQFKAWTDENTNVKFTFSKSYSGAHLKGLDLTLNGGNDTFKFDMRNHQYSTNLDLNLDMGGGNDKIDITDIPAHDGNHFTLAGGSGNDTIIMRADSKVGAVIYGDEAHSAYDASLSYNDTINAGNGNNTIYGGWGNDTITTGNGDNLIYGGNGTDGTEAHTGSNIISTGSGNDTVYGGSGNDIIDVGEGSDTVYAGAGNDIINVGMRTGQDIDKVYTGPGADLIICGGVKSDYVFEGASDQEANPWSEWAVDEGFKTGKEVVTASLEAAGFAFAGSTSFGIVFGLGVSALSTGVMSSIFGSGGGDETTKVSAHQDYAYVGDFDLRNDVFVYTATHTEQSDLTYFKEEATSNGEYEVDTDVDNMGNGGVVARLAINNDLVSYMQKTSGSGTSAANIKHQLSTELINTSFSITYDDGHYVDKTGAVISDSDLSQHVGDGTSTLQDELDGLGLSDGQTVLITGAYSGQYIAGEDINNGGNLFIAGTDYGDAIYAENMVKTNQHSDTYLYGFGGDDVIVGGDSNDMIFGGTGNDTLTGNGGSDTFVFEKNAGNDTITDFDINTDTLRFIGDGVIKDDLNISQVSDSNSPTGESAVISYHDNSITLEGVTASDLQHHDLFTFS
ncbi:calcium-binding protein [Flexibacterium corallicola]|uniref:calcium-binding protein n=1 Tax=Flexibacterium corallicola TaxID=3037259 RepID=UPI00286F3CFA|nr:hypothetical protein [Pseudovibrio sp. M1P-2-3]